MGEPPCDRIELKGFHHGRPRGQRLSGRDSRQPKSDRPLKYATLPRYCRLFSSPFVEKIVDGEALDRGLGSKPLDEIVEVTPYDRIADLPAHPD